MLAKRCGSQSYNIVHLTDMNDITFSCPKCGHHISIDESRTGIMACPHCFKLITAPTSQPSQTTMPQSVPSAQTVRSAALRDSILRARTSEQKAELIIQNKAEIRRAFPDWLTIPPEYSGDAAAESCYAETLISIAVVFSEHFGDATLMQQMRATNASPKKPWWKIW